MRPIRKLAILALLSLSSLPALAATGDIVISYKGATGQTTRLITPGTATDVLALNGSGLVSLLPRSTFGTVSTLSVATANGISGSVANATTTPEITLSLGAITPSALAISTNGAANTPPHRLTGTWFSGGTATTTKPQLLIEPTGATSTAWSTSGTGLGLNAATGFTGNLIDAQINGSQRFAVAGGNSPVLTLRDSGNVTFTVTRTAGNHTILAVNSAGMGFAGSVGTTLLNWDSNWQLSSTAQLGWSSGAATLNSNANDVRLSRDAANRLQLGADAATPVAQTIKAADGTGTNVAGSPMQLSGGSGTGSADGGEVRLLTAPAGSSGATANSAVVRLTVKPSGVLNLATIPTSSAGLVTGDIWSDGGTLKIIP